MKRRIDASDILQICNISIGLLRICFEIFKTDSKFEKHFDKHGKCKFVLASESGKFKEEGMGGHFPASYLCDMGVGLLLISSSRYSRTCLLNGLRCHAFCIWNTNNSFFGIGKDTLNSYIMYTLNFPDGRSQTYPDQNTLMAAVRAMGGEAKNLGNHIFVFVPKK